MIFPSVKTEHELIVYFRALFYTFTMLHEAHEYRLRKTEIMLRDAFDSGQLHVLRRFNGNHNVSDALTKRNQDLFRQFYVITSSGL